MKAGRAAAIVTYAYAAAFGIPAVPVAIYVAQRDRLPSFFGLFPMYGGPWSESVDDETLIALLTGYLVLMGAVAWTGLQVERGSRRGVIANLALLPIEAVFWIGFALPLPWLTGAARVVLLTRSWSELSSAQPPR